MLAPALAAGRIVISSEYIWNQRFPIKNFFFKAILYLDFKTSTKERSKKTKIFAAGRVTK